MGSPPWTRAGWCAEVFAVAAAMALCVAHPLLARDFRAADTQPADYPTVEALLHMDQLVSERTNGRHRIHVFHSRQLGEEKETIEQTRVGAIDLNRTNVAPLGSFASEANALAMPFLFRSVEHLHQVLDGAIGEEILAGFRPHGFIGLAFYDSGARSIYNARRPIRTPDDIVGLHMRVQQSAVMSAMMKALGAQPVELPYGQVLTGLTTGLIDGAENNWPSYVTTEHYKVARYYTLTEHTMGPEVLIMSVRAWDALSPEDQRIFKDAARESGQLMRRRWLEWEEKSRRQAESAGNVIITKVDKAPFENVLASIYVDAAGDARVRSLIGRIRQAR
ncbi:MAG: TRAP transporter substrate-binding protein [Variibacter sp.]|nr:TRAP transporter substrate-binding protein [Variibacter sp.]